MPEEAKYHEIGLAGAVAELAERLLHAGAVEIVGGAFRADEVKTLLPQRRPQRLGIGHSIAQRCEAASIAVNADHQG